MTQEIHRQTNTGLSLKDRLHLKRNATALLLDVSGSMSSDCEPGHSKIQALREIVGQANTGSIFYFADSCQPCTKATVPNPHGGTYMARAFDFLKRAGISAAVLITDGEANDKSAALEAVKGLKLQILYIGPGARPEFLDRLANLAGGFCTKEDLLKPKELSEKITLLLGMSTTSGGPMCL